MPRHSEERGKEHKQRKETTNVWAIVKIHLSKNKCTQMSCDGQRAQRIAKRWERYVEKN